MKTKKVRVRINNTDIKDGLSWSDNGCPFGLALKRVLTERAYESMTVDYPRTHILDFHLKNPERLETFLRSYDETLIADPTSFNLELPVTVLKKKFR